METAQRTPGPWNAQGMAVWHDPQANKAGLCSPINIIANCLTGKPAEENVANARLCALAPEMFNALEEYVAEWDEAHAHEDGRTGITYEPYSLITARAVIDKEKG